MRWFGSISYKLIFLLLLWATPALGAIALDQNAANNNNTGGASITTSFTCTSGASLIVVRVSTYDFPNIISSMTYNSTSGTERAENTKLSTQTDGAYLWTLPGTGCDGSPHNLVVNFSPNSAFGAYVRIDSLTGSDTSTPTGNTFGTAGLIYENVSSPVSDSISVSSGSVVFDVATTNCAVTVGGSQTQDFNTAWGGQQAAGSHLLNATAMSWTFSGTCGRFAHAGVEVKEAGAAPSTTIRHRRVQ